MYTDMYAYIQARRCARHRRQPRTAIASDHSPPSIDPHLRSLGWAGQPPRIYRASTEPCTMTRLG